MGRGDPIIHSGLSTEATRWVVPAGQVAGVLADNGTWSYYVANDKHNHEVHLRCAAWGATRVQVQCENRDMSLQTLVAAAAADITTTASGFPRRIILTVTDYAGTAVAANIESWNEEDAGAFIPVP